MSGFRAFTRQLGSQPGVQLNPLQDATDGAVPDNSDQIIATIARLSRGRIDRPFRVNRSNFLAKTGGAASLRASALNEAKLQVYEAATNGAYEVVLQRLVSDSAAKKYAVVSIAAGVTSFATADAIPTEDFVLWLLHLDCFNEGIKVSLHADQVLAAGVPAATTLLKLRVSDANDVVLDEFEGSLDPAAVDDFGKSLYLPDVIASRTDSYQIGIATGASIDATTDFYGRDTSNNDKWVTSATLVCFTEGSTAYTNGDYDRCIDALRNTVDTPFGYLMTGGTQAVALIGKIAALGIEINTKVGVDVPGNLSVGAAIAFVEALNVDSHYVDFYWAPLEADDPMNGGKAVWGASGLNLAFRCARNARVNAKGFAPKNFPVAGKDWPINRTGVRQLVRPSEQDLSDLAKARINPVVFETYNGGGRYVFTDSLTAAKTQVSYRKLISVSEMATTIDTWVALYAKELLQLPMAEFIRRMNAFLKPLFEGAQASGWLVPSTNLQGNAAFQFDVRKSDVRPADLVLVDYWTCYDGVARQVILQQNLVK